MSKKKEDDILDLDKHFKDDDTPLDKGLTMPSQNVQEDPYELFYDDSSSEEDYDEIMQHNSLDSTRKILNLNAKRAFIKELKNSNSEVQLSVFLHEIGNRLINSKEVNKKYYPLKREKIPQKKVLTDSQLKDLISKAFDDTFDEMYRVSNKLKENNEDAILEFQKYVLGNKRKFIKNISDKSKILETLQNQLNESLSGVKAKGFIVSLKEKIISNFKLVSSQNITRVTLDNGSEIILDECGPKSLAQIRLMNRSDIRKIKNLQAQKNNTFDDNLSSNVKLIKFQNSKETISERVKYNVSSAKTLFTKISKIDSLSSYSNISNTIDKIKVTFSLDDKKIVEIIKSRLKGQVLNIDFPPKISSTEKNQFEKFISAFTYLLFGVEVSRNPKSLLIHQMLLELIETDKLSWSEALKSMPMSIAGATQASRWQHSNYKTLFPYKYDKGTINAGNTNKATIKNLVEKESNIFKKWLELKDLLIKKNDATKILNTIVESCQEWYSIKIETKLLKFLLLSLRDVSCYDTYEINNNYSQYSYYDYDIERDDNNDKNIIDNSDNSPRTVRNFLELGYSIEEVGYLSTFSSSNIERDDNNDKNIIDNSDNSPSTLNDLLESGYSIEEANFLLPFCSSETAGHELE